MLQTSVAPTAANFRIDLDDELDGFLAERAARLAEVDAELGLAASELRSLAAGGKRIRPWFVEWGHRAAGGVTDARLVRAAAAVELIHTFALVQDDIIDRSGLRRGRDAVHVALARAGGAHHGLAAALLASDLALIWADILLLESGYGGPPLEAALGVVGTLREEVTVGQFQELAMTTFGRFDQERALLVIARKTAGYTVRRPLELGAALAGAGTRLAAPIAAYARPAGTAFQLRDDLLGAFGDPQRTGKPDLDDLAAAKPTWLLARGMAGAGPASSELRRLAALHERGATDVALMREALVASGAVADTERLIQRLRKAAQDAVEVFPVDAEMRAELAAFTDSLVERDR